MGSAGHTGGDERPQIVKVSVSGLQAKGPDARPAVAEGLGGVNIKVNLE